MKNTKILIALALIIGGGAALYALNKPKISGPLGQDTPNNSGSEQTATENEDVSGSENGTSTSSPESSQTDTASAAQSEAVRKLAWETFQKYLGYAKARDLEGITRLSHQISDTCKNPGTQDQCGLLMSGAYDIGSKFEENNFKNVWFDSKQIILYSVIKREENDKQYTWSQSLIYFTRADDGSPKVLGINPARVYFALKSENTRADAERVLSDSFADVDKDGIEDYAEKCLTTDKDGKCIAMSNPAKRDTNGNGWWDGIEALFNKK